MNTETDQSDISKYKIMKLEEAVEELKRLHDATTAELKLENKTLQKELTEYRREEALKEKQLLLWGIMTLGAVVTTLGGILWGIIKGNVVG